MPFTEIAAGQNGKLLAQLWLWLPGSWHSIYQRQLMMMMLELLLLLLMGNLLLQMMIMTGNLEHNYGLTHTHRERWGMAWPNSIRAQLRVTLLGAKQAEN